MRLVRGSTLRGYAGFKREVDKGSYLLVRPLISVSKQELLDYDEKMGIPYVIDNSNHKDKYTRNRYRMKMLPFLKKEDPDVHHKFLKFSEELISVNNFLEKYIQELIENISDVNGIKIDELKKLDKFLLKKVVEYTLTKIYIDDLFLINDKHTFLIIGLIRSDKSNNRLDLPNNYQAIKSYNYKKKKKNRRNDR